MKAEVKKEETLIAVSSEEEVEGDKKNIDLAQTWLKDGRMDESSYYMLKARLRVEKKRRKMECSYLEFPKEEKEVRKNDKGN